MEKLEVGCIDFGKGIKNLHSQTTSVSVLYLVGAVKKIKSGTE